jgi:ubiquinone/menaquinone biosynthesis C-methylase UbiE
MSEELLWLNLRELPYFRAILRAVEGRLVREIELPSPVLDLGCGDGHFASVTYDRPLEIGLDPSEKPMREAQTRKAYKLLVQADGACMPFKDGAFSSALSNSVLEHIPHLDDVLHDLSRVLKPEAPFVFTVPNPGYEAYLSVSNTLRNLRLRTLAKVYQDWFMKMSRTVNLLDEDQWSQKLTEAGFVIERTIRYFSPSALRALEWGHYFGAPCVLARWLTGRWILSPTRWNLELTARRMRRYVEEAPSENGTYNFYLARKL